MVFCNYHFYKKKINILRRKILANFITNSILFRPSDPALYDKTLPSTDRNELYKFGNKYVHLYADDVDVTRHIDQSRE